MSTQKPPPHLCVDCWDFRQHTPATTASRCDAHRAAYRRWYKAKWKAAKTGAPSAERKYVAERVRIEQVVIDPLVIEKLDRLRAELDVATRKLTHDLRDLPAGPARTVSAIRARVARTSSHLEQIVNTLTANRMTAPIERPKGARRTYQ